MKVAFIHPDLVRLLSLYTGDLKANRRELVCFRELVNLRLSLAAGGAERLVVDAAVGLQELGHQVQVYTSHHDSTRCFTETQDGLPLSSSQ
jgi:hypothetical protein